MAEAISASLVALSVILLTITECPETEVATSLILILLSAMTFLIADETISASMIEPSTTTSRSKARLRFDLARGCLLDPAAHYLSAYYIGNQERKLENIPVSSG